MTFFLWLAGTKLQHSTSKLQRKLKLQYSTIGYSGCGDWKFFGVWSLVFGAFGYKPMGCLASKPRGGRWRRNNQCQKNDGEQNLTINRTDKFPPGTLWYKGGALDERKNFRNWWTVLSSRRCRTNRRRRKYQAAKPHSNALRTALPPCCAENVRSLCRCDYFCDKVSV